MDALLFLATWLQTSPDTSSNPPAVVQILVALVPTLLVLLMLATVVNGLRTRHHYEKSTGSQLW